MRIKCEGQHITVELNGELVTEMDMSKWTSGTVNRMVVKSQAGFRNHLPNFQRKDISDYKVNMVML